MDIEQRSRAALEVAEQLVAARAAVAALEAKFHELMALGCMPRPHDEPATESIPDPAPPKRRGRIPKFDATTIARIASLHAADMTQRAIAVELGIHKSSIFNILKRLRASGEVAAVVTVSNQTPAPRPIRPVPIDRDVEEPSPTAPMQRPATVGAVRRPPKPQIDTRIPAVIRADGCLGRMSPTGRISHDQMLDLHESIEVMELEAWRIALEFKESAAATRRIIARFADELSQTGVRAIGEQTMDSEKADALRSVKFDPKTDAIRALRLLDLDRNMMRVVVVELEAARYVVARVLRERFDEATRLRERFVVANMGLVHMVARKYAWSSMPISELMQEGAMGLMHAIPRYDRGRGFKFSTYAQTWIRHGIGRYLENAGDNVRIPTHARASLRKLNLARAKLRAQHGEEPSHADLSAETGIAAAAIRKLESGIVREAYMPPEASDRMFAKVADPSMQADDVLIDRENRVLLHAAIARLPGREREVIERRFGIVDDGDGEGLKSIGQEYDLSRERIRQIEMVALRKLRRFLSPDDSEMTESAP